ALFAFVFVPRLASPLWGAPAPGTAQTGLSRSMSPGSFTELLIDDSPAMRVSFEGPPPPPAKRYFRGWVMSYFDGHSWQHRIRRDRHPEPVEVLRTIRYQVELEPTGSHLLPAHDVPLQGPEGTAVSSLRSMYREKRVNSVYRYRAQS